MAPSERAGRGACLAEVVAVADRDAALHAVRAERREAARRAPARGGREKNKIMGVRPPS
jgi:hypothetical protein